MEDLGAEVGELGGLLEADAADAKSVRTDAWVGGHNAVDIGPDLDGAGVQPAAHERAGVIRAAPAKRSGHPVR